MKFFDLAFHIGLVFILTSSALSFGPARFRPEHKGVDPELQSYTNEWKSLAKDRKIEFKNEVTIGFHPLAAPVIGECFNSISFREIDIDKDFWDNQGTELSKMILIYHELTHCYCGRSHDFAAGKEYPSGYNKPKGNETVEGFFSDHCPKSIMFPSVLPDDCTLAHYSDYVDEMFDRCEAF